MRRWAGFIAMMLGFFTLTGCGERHDWNQKVTVTVETPSGEVSGSSVQRVSWTGGELPKNLRNGPNMVAEKRGEAVVVDLGGGHFLFSLLIGDGKSFKGQMEDIALHSLCPPDASSCLKKIETLPYGTKAELAGDNLPMLVTFGDINDPKTVKRVDPNDLDAAFGLCADGSGLKEADAPWRAEGLLWLDWRDMEAWKTSRNEAAMKVGLSDDVAASIAEYDMAAPSAIYNLRIEGLIRRASEKKYKESSPERIKQLQAMFSNNDQFNAWQTARFEIFNSLIAPDKRDASADCHWLKSISIEITDEKVTEGKVEKVLGWWNNPDKRIGVDTARYGEPLYGINKLDFERKAQ